MFITMKSSVNFKDLTGKVFGRLTVIKRDPDSVKVVYWFCLCSCGKEKRVRGTHLNSGAIRSCGCLLNRPSGHFKDLTGKTFGYLTVIGISSRGDKPKWKVRCKCGKEFIADGTRMKSRHTKSCGCYQTEILKKIKRTHGMTVDNERLYNIWMNMKHRCYNNKCDKYEYYGGRGISICNEWMNDSTLFFKWALANGYKNNLTIHRDDNDGNYCPSNCVWITQREQMQRTSRTLDLNIVRKIKNELKIGNTVSSLAKKYKLHYDRVLDIKRGETYNDII